jgi:hypothetical protein
MRETNVEAVKITNQFRSKDGFVYDLRSEGARLTVTIMPREHSGDLGDWKIEARASHGPDAVAVTEWGKDRVEVLREVGRSWADKALEHGLPAFDWEAVAKALKDVRAI